MVENRNIGTGGYGTHLTPLIAVVLATFGNVIELGMGDYSTPVLHEIIKFQNTLLNRHKRKLISYESNKEWLNNFVDLMTDYHQIKLVENWDSVKITENTSCSVLFVDHAPANRRIIEIERFKDFCDIIVVHDTEKTRFYGYEPLLSKFNSRLDYKRYAKRTTLVSNFFDLNKILSL